MIEEHFTHVRDQNPEVCVVVASRRRDFAGRIATNFRNQRGIAAELIVVIHGSENLSERLVLWLGDLNCKIFVAPPETSLGEMLNFAVSKSRSEVICKWDDDDFYGRWFLVEQLQALQRTGAGLVGKGSWFSWMEKSNSLYHRFPGMSDRIVSYLAGGTIMGKAKTFGSHPFQPISLGEDQRFIADCREAGNQVWSTTEYNYIQVRSANLTGHSWQIEDEEYLRKCKFVGRQLDFVITEARFPKKSHRSVVSTERQAYL